MRCLNGTAFLLFGDVTFVEHARLEACEMIARNAVSPFDEICD